MLLRIYNGQKLHNVTCFIAHIVSRRNKNTAPLQSIENSLAILTTQCFFSKLIGLLKRYLKPLIVVYDGCVEKEKNEYLHYHS